jgi:hypothetical protein
MGDAGCCGGDASGGAARLRLAAGACIVELTTTDVICTQFGVKNTDKMSVFFT